MKKTAVLTILFVLPIVCYLFFSSGINGFSTLPTVTPHVEDMKPWTTLRNDTISLNDKITILGFGGEELLANRGNLFNLNMKIYERYHEFDDLQFVILCPLGTEKEAKHIVEQFATIVDVSHWNFVFAPKDEIIAFHKGLKLKAPLDQFAGTPEVYIIDKERNLRGRKHEDPKDYKEGYNTFSVGELSNEMLDDFKIILYEYRAALKKNRKI